MKSFFAKNNIPNILTILRILFIPFIITFLVTSFGPTIINFTIFQESKYWSLTTNIRLNWLLSGILFLLASITDFFDGYLSRKYKWISDFGKIWDPIADKILINSILITLSAFGFVMWYLVVVMISRDLIVDGYRTFLSSKKIIIPANILGKLKTVFQMIGVLIVLFIFNDKNINSNSYYLLQNIFLIIATIISIISGIVYVLIANIRIFNLQSSLFLPKKEINKFSNHNFEEDKKEDDITKLS